MFCIHKRQCSYEQNYFFLCFPVLVFAQKQKVDGTVENLENEKLTAVKIELFNSDNELIRELKTDSRGSFTLEGIAEQNIKLVATVKGYSLYEQLLNLENPEDLRIILKKKLRK